MPPNKSGIAELAARAKKAAGELAQADTQTKNSSLKNAAEFLRGEAAGILKANQKDVSEAEKNGIAANLIDRLRLTEDRIDAMADGLEKVAELPDPIGEVVYKAERPNGLKIAQIRVPLGVVAIIYESRPNVTSDSAGLCIKSSNAAFLRGSSAAIHSNAAIEEVMREAAAAAGLPADSVILVRDTDYDSAVQFMQMREYVDCLIPRGGPNLIASILENATVPYIIDGDGNCHIYVDADADLDMATAVIVNAKTQRTSVCNAAESLVIHSDIAEQILPRLVQELKGVEIVGDDVARQISKEIKPMEEGDFGREFLDMKISVKTADSLEAAIDHINAYNSGHSEAIITENPETAEVFINNVDSGSVLVNASTRFINGEELGFGAEIGISTQKLHARGPLGLKQLTCLKFVVRGTGQIRK